MAKRKKQRSDDDDTLTLRGALKALQFDRNNLDDAVMMQTHLYAQVTAQVELAISNRDDLKFRLETLMAEKDAKIRRKAANDDEKKKPSEKAILSLVEADDDVTELRRELMDAQTEVRQWTAMKGNYDQRSSMLKVMANLYASNYFTRSSVSGDVADTNRREAGKKRRNRDDDDDEDDR